MTDEQPLRLPTPGEWHDTLDDIVPGAHPNRPPQPPTGTTNRTPRRKVAVARRSRERLALDGNYFYWCENCDYCNTAAEGQQARCANHQRAHEAARKARQRHWDQQGGRDPAQYQVSRELVTEVYDQATALKEAAGNYERALRLRRSDPATEFRALDRAIRSMARTVSRLPRPNQT